MYFGYRSETNNGLTSRDIFPFITWDTGPDEINVSFLWRLLHYQRKGDRRGGHILFIPFGSDVSEESTAGSAGFWSR